MVSGLRIELSLSPYEREKMTTPTTRNGGAGEESNPSYSVRRCKET